MTRPIPYFLDNITMTRQPMGILPPVTTHLIEKKDNLRITLTLELLIGEYPKKPT